MRRMHAGSAANTMMRKPNLPGPFAGPSRQSRLRAALEVAFGWGAKGTMVLAGLAVGR